MKNINRLIPFGSWCRVAYQINLFKESHQIPKVSYPLDWCITPGESFEIILSDDFDINEVLSNSVICPITNSIQCKYTKIIFHHALNERRQRPRHIEQVKQRFIHTYQHYKDLRNMNEIIFVRWVKEDEYAYKLDMFTGYNYKLITERLKNFLQHENFKIIETHSEYFEQEKDRPDNQFELTDSPNYYKLHEKVPINFRGDEKSWIQLLTHLTQENNK